MRYRKNFGIFGGKEKRPPLGPPPMPRTQARPTMFQTAEGKKIRRDEIRLMMDEHARDLYKEAAKEEKKIYAHSKIIAQDMREKADRIQLMSEEEYCDYTGKCTYKKMNPNPMPSFSALAPHLAYGAASGAAFFASAFLLDRLKDRLKKRKTAKNPLSEKETKFLMSVLMTRMRELQNFLNQEKLLDAFYVATDALTIINVLTNFSELPANAMAAVENIKTEVFAFLNDIHGGIANALKPLPVRKEFYGLDFPEFTLAQNPDVVSQIMAFESGELDPDGVLDLFSHLIKTGMLYSLQGFYQRTARDLIRAGYLTPQGEIIKGFGSPKHPPGD